MPIHHLEAENHLFLNWHKIWATLALFGHFHPSTRSFNLLLALFPHKATQFALSPFYHRGSR